MSNQYHPKMLLCQILHTREQVCVTLCVDPAEHEWWGSEIDKDAVLSPFPFFMSWPLSALSCASVREIERGMDAIRKKMHSLKSETDGLCALALRGQQRSQLPKLNRYIYAGYILRKDSVF